MALTDKLIAIANAIRGKTGKSDGLTLDQMATEIAGISAGGVSEQELLDMIATRAFPVGDVVLNCDSIAESVFLGAGINSIKSDTVKTIATNAFQYCKLTSAEFPNVTTVGASAFRNSKVAEISFPSATTIGYSCFHSCPITAASLPMLKKIDTSLFQSSSLTIGKFQSATTIAAQAFSGCQGLTKLILGSATVCSMVNINAFNGTPFASGGTGGTVYVPAALIAQYQQATNWATLYAAGTCNFVAIEGSEYE